MSTFKPPGVGHNALNVSNTLECPTEKYRAELEDYGLTREEESNLLEALYSLMVSAVDLGIGFDPAEFLRDKSSDFVAAESGDPVKSKHSSTKTDFANGAADSASVPK